jgi:DNA polymerase
VTYAHRYSWRDVVRTDVETYSDVDIHDVGGWAYSLHPSTDMLIVGYQINDGEYLYWLPGEDPPEELWAAIRGGATMRAFNANFERAIFMHVLRKKYGWPRVELEQWECTQAVAGYCAFPTKLEWCAKALGLEQQKNKDGKALIRLFCQPRKPTKANPATRIYPKDRPEDFQRFIDYCLDDVRTERAVARALPISHLPKVEVRNWRVGSEVNRRGIPIDRELCRGAIALATRAQAERNAELQKYPGLPFTSATQTAKVRAWLATRGLKLDNMEGDTVRKALRKADELPDDVREVLEIRLAVASVTWKKYIAALDASMVDGRCHDAHQFCSAHTHRDGGRIVQFQNLARPTYKMGRDRSQIKKRNFRHLQWLHGDVIKALTNAIRHFVIASTNNVLLVSDLSSIEARMLGWWAEEPEYQKAFKNKLDLYIVMAAELFGVEYGDVTDAQRQIGKVCILALGYSMGLKAFMEYCDAQGIAVSEELLARAVKIYRRTFHRIPKLWYEAEDAMAAAALTGKRTRCGVVGFELVGRDMTMIMPNGTRLYYPDFKMRRGKTPWGQEKWIMSYMHDYHGHWLRTSTYGGMIVENGVQKMARDVMYEGLCKAEDAGLCPIFHVHDEVNCDVPEAQADRLAELDGYMKEVPEWAPGLLLDAKGFVSPYYKKG